MGDTSDNIPGIRGIGIKTAGKLIAEFGDLDTLIAKLAMVPSLKTREAIRAGSDQARLSKELARLDISTPVELSIEDMAVKPVDGETLLAFYRAMEFDALASKIEMEMAA
jgi:DNA polymerase-1